MKTYDMLIVGGGISGLSMAHYALRSNWRSAVLEATPEVGGLLHTTHFEKTDFWLELGGHSLFNSYRHLLGILKDVEQLEQVQKKTGLSFQLWQQNMLSSIPSQLSFPRLLLNIPKLFITRKNGLSVAQYYRKVVGDYNYEHVFRHAFNAVISQPADAFPADLLFRKKPRDKTQPRSMILTQGLQSIAEAIIGQNNFECLTGTEIKAITYQEGLFELTDQQNKKYYSRTLTLATPVATTVSLLKTAFPQLCESLQHIPSANIQSLGVLVDASAVSLKPVGGIIATDAAFYSVVSRDPLPNERYRGFTFHFKPQIDEKTRINTVCKVLNITPEQILQQKTRYSSLPSLGAGHHQNLVGTERV